ncbi:MAG: hypothetical protein QMD00_00540 [Hadesarchaea archaeon]|nr:hypothetical protein [Hadesarchaea archaeon]
MIDFDYYLAKEIVRRKSRDANLAESLLNSAKDRFKFAVRIEEDRPRYALELAYEAVRELLDALLSLRGYKTWSHEAAISFLMKLNTFGSTEVERLNVSRMKRHSSKYYGAILDLKEVEEEITFLRGIFQKLVAIVEKELKT